MRTGSLSKRKAFLEVFAKTGNIGISCQAAGISRTSHYGWMEDPEYRQQFELAKQDALDTLHAEAHRRGVLGWEEPVVYQGAYCYSRPAKGKKAEQITIRKYDPNLLMFLMRGMAPEIYRDTWKGEVRHSGAISRGPDLSNLSDEQLQQLESLFRLTDSSSSPIEGVAGFSAGGTGEESETQD